MKNTQTDFPARFSSYELLERNNINLTTAKTAGFTYPFWYYTSLETASKILENHEFWINNLSEMNDLSELRDQSELANKVHALCLCNSKSEKIPMWYLYAGLSGKGVSLGITPAKMVELLKSFEDAIVYTSDRHDSKLVYGKDFEFQYGWVYYRDSEQRFSYKRHWYQLNSKAEADCFIKNNYFIKDYPWEYEKEFRIVIINKTDQPFDKLIIKLPDRIFDKIKIRLAPEINKDCIWEEISQYPGFQKYFVDQLEMSKLNINMDLYGRNKREMLSFFREVSVKSGFNDDERKEIAMILNNIIQGSFQIN